MNKAQNKEQLRQMWGHELRVSLKTTQRSYIYIFLTASKNNLDLQMWLQLFPVIMLVFKGHFKSVTIFSGYKRCEGGIPELY